MNILVVFPSELEAKGFSYQGEHAVETLVSGIGGFATMHSLTKRCTIQKPDFVVHGGICGTFDSSFQIGEVVNVMIDHFADFGAFENGEWKTGFDLHLISSHKSPFTQGELVATHTDFAEVSKVSGVTLQTISSTVEQIAQLNRTFRPTVESMEGAYVHYVCIKDEIPFVHFRSISNQVGERDKSKWNIPLAVNNLHHVILQFLESL